MQETETFAVQDPTKATPFEPNNTSTGIEIDVTKQNVTHLEPSNQIPALPNAIDLEKFDSHLPNETSSQFRNVLDQEPGVEARHQHLQDIKTELCDLAFIST